MLLDLNSTLMPVPTTFPDDDRFPMCDVQGECNGIKTTVLPPTPPSSLSSRSSSPSPIAVPEDQSGASKKKKKKRSKKSAKAKETQLGGNTTEETEERPPALCISRNKHWRYISSYHVCWVVLGETVALIPFEC